ncbi:hypothetical protein E1A91_A03G067500v1 [Gossypium mustelinum]|uniref:Uncharacterized protein n=1 Tax=Gossypium mustelinum TaxID=34275 RepID=A0A5D2ZTD0_GOSMU|nr:hypothetical protein E1A91_A03G067500v1 [Gossypium mustelinum]
MGSPPTPKLSLYSFPSMAKEPSGMITPPIHASVSIPFLWEEAPGRSRLSYRGSENETDTSNGSKPNVARCLELPPRLLAKAKFANMPPPTTVLDGPDACRPGSFRSLDNKWLDKFGSSRSRSFRKAGRVVQRSFDFSTSVVRVGDAGGSGTTEVKIARVRKKACFLNLSHARSHVLASIYESFKKVVPWRRGHEGS